MTTTIPDSHAAYFAFRDRLLGELRTTVLTGDQLCEAGRLIYGRPEGLSLFGIPAPRMESAGIQLLGRTAIECCVDDYASAVADALADLHATIPDEGEEPLIVDLFCGSGNFSHHLGTRLGTVVHAAELDPCVHDATRHNLERIGAGTRLHLGDYGDLLGKLPPRGPRDTYFVEPPWGPAFTPAGLDLTRTAPPSHGSSTTSAVPETAAPAWSRSRPTTRSPTAPWPVPSPAPDTCAASHRSLCCLTAPTWTSTSTGWSRAPAADGSRYVQRGGCTTGARDPAATPRGGAKRMHGLSGGSRPPSGEHQPFANLLATAEPDSGFAHPSALVLRGRRLPAFALVRERFPMLRKFATRPSGRARQLDGEERRPRRRAVRRRGLRHGNRLEGVHGLARSGQPQRRGLHLEQPLRPVLLRERDLPSARLPGRLLIPPGVHGVA